MTRRIQEDDLLAIEDAVRLHPNGMNTQQLHAALSPAPPRRTLQYRLKFLVADKRLILQGGGRGARYCLPEVNSAPGDPALEKRLEDSPPLSQLGASILKYVNQPLPARKPVNFSRKLLSAYRPNETFYLTPAERAQLHEIGKPNIAKRHAGVYARKLLKRLLVDLSWNSSRLEGNSYSLLETLRLVELGETVEGKDPFETQMILNHKEAIAFLFGTAQEIGFDRYTILNLHALLAGDLLADPEAAGRLRQLGVDIPNSVFRPAGTRQMIEDCFTQILATAAAIIDPFEQAFFVMAQLPYLQPFDDANERVSRLAANIPLIKANLSPLSFEGLPRNIYNEAVLGVYELNRIELLRDVFLWAYKQSATRYAPSRQAPAGVDPFRLRHWAALRELAGAAVRGRMDKKQAAVFVGAWTQEHIGEQEREWFRAVAERELLSLHEGNFARYQITPAEFAAWQDVWSR